MKNQFIKKSVTFFIVMLSIVLSKVTAQEAISAAQWQEDLRYFQEKVHNDYSFLFKKVTLEEFNAEVDQLYTDIPSLAAHELPVAFSRIVSLFKYGHTQITFGTIAKDAVLPINLYQFTDGIFIEGAHKTYSNSVGARVVAVEGIPIEDALEMIRPVVPVENNQYFKAFGLKFVTSPAVLHAQSVITDYKTSISLTLEKNGKTFNQTFTSIPLKELSVAYNFSIPTEEWVTARDQSYTPLHLKDLHKKLYYFEYLKDKKIVYARQSQVVNDTKESLEDFYKRLFAFIENNDVEKLIYDVRHNGGGNNFLNTALITGIIETKKINQKGKLFVITGRRTFSACQNMVNRLDMYTNAIFVGEATSENINFYGDARPVVLPNSKLTAYMSWAWWQDRAPWENADALVPELPVALSFNDYATNRDPVLQTAIDYKNDNSVIMNPMDHLTKLFINNDFETFEKDLKSMVNDNRYAHLNFERKMDDIANMLTDQRNFEGANYLFELNTRLFPKSVNTWIHLSKFKIKTKKNEEAKTALKMASSLNPKKHQMLEIQSLLKALNK